MTSAQDNYRNELLLVTLGHGLVIGSLIALSLIQGCDGPVPDMTSQTALFVEAPPSDEHEIPVDLAKPLPPELPDTPSPPKVTEPVPDRDDIPLLDKAPKEKPKPEKAKPQVKPPSKIKISKTVVRRPLPNGKGKLTPEEVRKLLERGAKLGPKSSLSEADMRRLLNGDTRFGDGSPITQEYVVLDMVRQAMYRAWNQPADIGIAGLVTKVELTFSPDGTIVASRLLAGSGNRTMDASVMQAVQSVHRVSGLSSAFLSSHRRIPVSFELTGDR